MPFDDEFLRGKLHRRNPVRLGSPGRRIVAVNGRRLRERSVSIKYLGRNVSAAETGYRPNAGQPHLPHRPASQVVLHDGAVRAIEVMREQRPAGHGRRDQLPIGCGQQFGDLRITGAEIHLQQPTVRRSLVRMENRPVVLRINQRIIAGKPEEQLAKRPVVPRKVAVQHFVAAGSLGDRNEELPVVPANRRSQVAQRMLFVAIYRAVGRLIGPDPVKKHFLRVVAGRQRLFRSRPVVPAVIKPVSAPYGSGEFDPTDAVGQQVSRSELLYAKLHPIRTRFGRRKSHVTIIPRERHAGQRDRTFFRQRIRIEEYLGALPVPLPVQNALVPQPVVFKEKTGIAVAFRNPVLRIIPQFGQPGGDPVAFRKLRQVAAGHFVLGRHPADGFVRTVVFEPAVGIGHFGSEIIVRRIVPPGNGIGQFYRSHI